MDTTDHNRSSRRDQVICLHSSMSSSRQWEDLMLRLQHEFDVTAVDLHGYGSAPEWASEMHCSLDREIERLADVIDELEEPIHLVGHSYGGAVAIKAARSFGPRISSLTLYEPVIFSALFEDPADPEATLEIIRLVEEFRADYRSGELIRAAERFIDYWSGRGTWLSLPLEKRLRLAAQVPTVLANFEAVISERNALTKLAETAVPTLYLSGQESPASMQAITDIFKLEMPHSIRHRFKGMGHMGPITHATIVNARIERFIKHQSAMLQRQQYAWAA